VSAALLSGEEKETSSCGAPESGIVMLKNKIKEPLERGVACAAFRREKGIIQKVTGVAAFWKVAMPWHDAKCSSQHYGMQSPMQQHCQCHGMTYANAVAQKNGTTTHVDCCMLWVCCMLRVQNKNWTYSFDCTQQSPTLNTLVLKPT